MFITKKSLNRRTLLRGTGAALALPLLDAMTPAFAATPKAVPNRCAFPEKVNRMSPVPTNRNAVDAGGPIRIGAAAAA